MKVLLYGKNSKDIEELVTSLGFEIVTANPDVVISYGGDGTLLSAERLYPGLPKLPIRNSQVCKKCSIHDDKSVLTNSIEGRLELKEYRKLTTTILYKVFHALNDFVIRNSDPTHTIRFRVTSSMSSSDLIGGSINKQLLIGDGIVVATSFGSTGYFKSIARQILKTGFGVAFNNTTQNFPPLILKQEDSVNFQLIRGKAVLSFDNNPDIFTIDEGSQISFKLSDQVARIYEDTSLRCPKCKVIRG